MIPSNSAFDSNAPVGLEGLHKITTLVNDVIAASNFSGESLNSSSTVVSINTEVALLNLTISG